MCVCFFFFLTLLFAKAERRIEPSNTEKERKKRKEKKKKKKGESREEEEKKKKNVHGTAHTAATKRFCVSPVVVLHHRVNRSPRLCISRFFYLYDNRSIKKKKEGGYRLSPHHQLTIHLLKARETITVAITDQPLRRKPPSLSLTSTKKKKKNIRGVKSTSTKKKKKRKEEEQPYGIDSPHVFFSFFLLLYIV